jgi:hypothetical protein
MSLADYTLHKAPQAKDGPLSQAELLKKRDEIDEQLTEISLSSVNLTKELMIQLKKAKLLQGEASQDRDTPFNQRAQVQNSLNSTMQSLAKLQASVYSSERAKRMEMALATTLKEFPALQEAFLTRYTELGLEEMKEVE